MEWVNYQHLQYFWVVAREGSIRAASDELRLAPSTISSQLKQLAEQLGHDLFERAGRNLVLTDFGRDVFHYADAIFTTGRDLLDFVHGRRPGHPLRLDVGVAGVVPKLLAHKFIEPALGVDQSLHLVVREDRQDRLLDALAAHRLDVVITDAPIGPETRVKAYAHPLGVCGVTFFAAPELHDRLADRPFPECLDGAPFLLPTSENALRPLLDHWFEARGIHPIVVAECDDSALLKVFAQHGHGILTAPEVLADEISRQFQIRSLGRPEGVEERFYAISIERRIKHPGVARMKRSATALLGHI